MTVDEVKEVLLETLGIEDQRDQIGPDTKLIGSLPELDSLAVVELLTELDRHFGLDLAAEDLSAEVFETLQTLTAFVSEQSSS